jgi:hypothetical protein
MHIAGVAIVAYFLKRTIHPVPDMCRLDAIVTGYKGGVTAGQTTTTITSPLICPERASFIFKYITQYYADTAA